MNSNSQQNAQEKTTRMLFVLGILIFTYTLLRAGLLSITWDESQSYHEYIRNHTILLDRYDFMSANNHILNTLGGIIFTELFGVSEFTLRIPALIAHVLFLFFSAKLVLGFGNKWMAVSAFLILNTNPFLLDFFSLSRGYGISLGLMMVSVYYLYGVHLNGRKTKDITLTVVFAALATLGNLTLLNYCVVSFGVITLLVFYDYKQSGKTLFAGIQATIRKMLLPGILLLLFLAFILPISFDLRAVGALFMGGEIGLWTDTLGTIVPRLWYELDFNYWLQRATKLFFFLIFFSAAAFVFYQARKKQTTKRTEFLLSLLLILFLIILSTVVQHYLLQTLYLIERTVLFLFVLLMLIFVFFMNEFSDGAPRRQNILHVFALLFSLHLLFSMNLKYVHEWKEDCETKDMLSDLIKLRTEPEEKFNLTLGLPLSLESSINYYREVSQLTWLNETSRDKNINYLNDYFFLRPMDTINRDMDSLEIIKTYPLTRNILAKPKYPRTAKVVLVDSLHEISRGEPFKVDSAVEFSPGYNFIIKESFPVKKSILSCQIQFQPLEEFSANVYYVVACFNAKGMYEWKNLRLNDFCLDKNGAATANFTTFIPEEMKSGDELKIYLWNPDKQQFLLSKMRLKWIHYF